VDLGARHFYISNRPVSMAHGTRRGILERAGLAKLEA
jgi:hypothetical protein